MPTELRDSGVLGVGGRAQQVGLDGDALQGVVGGQVGGRVAHSPRPAPVPVPTKLSLHPGQAPRVADTKGSEH